MKTKIWPIRTGPDPEETIEVISYKIIINVVNT